MTQPIPGFDASANKHKRPTPEPVTYGVVFMLAMLSLLLARRILRKS